MDASTAASTMSASQGTHRAYVSTLLAKNAHMRPDPATLPAAGRQDTQFGDAGSKYHHRRAQESPATLHVANGAGRPFVGTSVTHDTLPAHPKQVRFVMHKGLGPVAPGTNPPVAPENRCGIGRSIPSVTDTASWVSEKNSSIDGRGGGHRGLGETKRAEWASDKAVVRGGDAWQPEQRSSVGNAACYDQARQVAAQRQQQLLAKKTTRVGGVASAPYATDV
jgi:hypothetical protein